MKKLLFIFIITATVQAQADWKNPVKGNGKIAEQERKVAPFNKISTGGSVNLIIIQGQQEGIAVTTDENLQEYIITEVIDNTLQIHMKEKSNISPTKLKIKVTYSQLNFIEAGGSGDIESDGIIKSEKLKISQGGSGDFKLNLDIQNLSINKSGSGDFKLNGKADQLEINSAGSGDVHASSLEVKNCKISMVGSGDIHLEKGTAVDLRKVGSGEIIYE